MEILLKLEAALGGIPRLRFRYFLIAGFLLPFIFIAFIVGAVEYRLGVVRGAMQSLNATVYITPNILRLNSYVSRMERATLAYALINGQQSIRQGYPLVTYNNAKLLAHQTLDAIIRDQKLTNVVIEESNYLQSKLARMESLCGQIIDLVNSGKQKEAIDLINQGDLIRFGQATDLDAEALTKKDLVQRHDSSDQLLESIIISQNFIKYGSLIAVLIGLIGSGAIVYKLFKSIKLYAENIAKTVLDVDGTVKANGAIVSDLTIAVAESSATISALSDSAKAASIKATSSAQLAKEAEAMATENFELMQTSQNEMIELNSSIKDSEARLGALDLQLEKINVFVEKINELSMNSGLLGLNASIEAVNAGEFGRSFLVISHEVQILSGQIKSLNRDVGEALLGIQKAMNQMKEASGKNLKLSVGASDGMTQAGVAFDSIKKLAVDVNKNINQVLLDSTSQSGALGQINVAMKMVHSNGVIVNSGSEQTNKNMRELSAVVENLNRLI